MSEKTTRESTPGVGGMDEERTDSGRVGGRIEERLTAALELIAPVQRSSAAPAAGCGEAVRRIDHEVRAVVDELRVGAEYKLESTFDLLRRVITHAQRTHRLVDQSANRVDVIENGRP